MTKKLALRVGLGGLVIAAAVAVGLYTNLIKLPITRPIHVQYVADFNDDKVLMGASHYVFVGKVIKQVGNKDTGIGPETQFAVEVVQNIKGNLSGTVTVQQQGGYQDGVLYLVEGDTSLPESSHGEALLLPGATYVLATRYNLEEKWYTLIPHPKGKKLLSSDIKLSREQLQTMVKKDPRILQLTEAYAKEVLLEADVQNNNTLNSYQKLPK